MKLDIDSDEGTVSFAVPAQVYSAKAIEVAAHVFDRRAEVFLGEAKGSFDVSLKAKRKGAGEDDLRRLGGEFVNELLNQEYRFLVSGFNKKITELILTQALFAARGGENPPPKADESAPEFIADVAKMMKEAEQEIRRTMPKKLPPQGNPLPPAKEDAVV